MACKIYFLDLSATLNFYKSNHLTMLKNYSSNIYNVIKNPTAIKKLLIAIVLITYAGFNSLYAQVTITAPSLTVTACSFPTNSSALGDIVITESLASDILGSGTLILTAPTNFEFTNQGTASATGTEITGVSAALTNSTTITLTFTVGGTVELNAITISGIQVIGITAATAASDVTRTGGTSVINGDANGAVHATLTSLLNSVTGGTIAAAQTICSGGDPAAFTESAASTGSGALTYKWKESTDGYSVTLATAATYDIPAGLTDTTTYRRITTSTLGGSTCTANSNDIIVTVIPNPTLSSSLTPPSICSGSVFSYTPTSATPGATFAWTRTAQTGIINATSSGADDPNETLIDTTATPVSVTYSYTITANGCSSNQNVVVTVGTALATPTIAVYDTTVFCVGDSAILVSSSATGNLWTGGSTNDSLTVYASGPYTVTVTSAGCSSISDTTTITVNPYPAIPTITTSDTVVFCTGSSVILYSSSAVGNSWTGGSTADSIIVATSGPYTVTVTIAGCSSVSADTTVTVNPLPTVTLAPFTTTPCSDDAPFALTGGLPAGGTYSGIGVTSGTTFNPGSAGAVQGITYTYVDPNGCANSASSNMTVVFCTGIEEYTSEGVSVYPNPTTSGIFNIAIRNASSTEMMISIIDIQGKEVYKALEKNISADYNKQINIMHLSKGIYYIKLSMDADVKIQKLIVE